MSGARPTPRPSLLALAGALTALVPAVAHAAEPPDTTVVLAMTLPPSADRCLDHAVRELGMSAKRAGTERRWDILPRFVHPSVVEGGAFTLVLATRPEGAEVNLTLRWRGAPQPDAVAAEVHARLGAVMEKLAQICGVLRPTWTCTRTAGGAPPRTCAPPPAP